ncbi:MAG: pantoate--beta-alanine ligase [Deltaproteobacteria bacterium]|nr:pantoate--beta-alanine ligase [Deltaproteobacteria bacterium]
MDLLKTIAAMRHFRKSASGKRIALVPTMGALHAGHLALMEAARKQAETVVVSVFVNPTQFGPTEDFARYPRDLAADTAKCESVGVSAVFAPESSEMYSNEASTTVKVAGVTEGLCGASRPIHFAGVATIVSKLFNIVAPDVAIFGQKDYQQLVTIRRLVTDLDFPVEIVAHPTVREPDGLAMSSRNAYLSPDDRRAAPRIFASLQSVRAIFRAGERRQSQLQRTLVEALHEVTDFQVEYAEIREQDSLRAVERPSRPIALVAGRLGQTRLIDNLALDE